MLVHFYIDCQIISERTTQHVSRLSVGRIFFREQLQPDVFVRDRMVASEKIGLTPADQVAARIADMGDGGAIVTQGAGNNRGCHREAARPSRMTNVNHARVRRSNQVRQKGSVWFARRCFAETSQHAFDRGVRSDFPEIVATNSIRERKKPATRAHVLWRRRERVPEIIFISLANSPNVRKFRELDIHRIVLGRAVGWGDPANI